MIIFRASEPQTINLALLRSISKNFKILTIFQFFNKVHAKIVFEPGSIEELRS